MKSNLLRLAKILTLSALISGCLFLFLPFLCDSYLLPRVIKDLPFSEKELSISRVSPWKTRATITLADTEREMLAIPKLELQYSPASLFRGKVNTVLLDSASIHLEMINGVPSIRGLSPKTQTNNTEEILPSLLLPVAVENLVIKNCTITVHTGEGETINVIVNSGLRLQFHDQRRHGKLIDTISGKIFTKGDIDLSGTIKITNSKEEQKLRLELDAPNINQLTTFFPQLNEQKITGKAAITGTFVLDQLTKIKKYRAKIELSRFSASNNSVIVESQSPENPIALVLNGNPNEMKYNLTGVTFSAPERGILDFKGILDIPNRSFTGSGKLFIEKIQSSLSIKYSGKQNSDHTNVEFEIQSEALNLAKRLSLTPITTKGVVNIRGSHLSGNLSLKVSKLTDSISQINFVDTSIQIPFQFPLPTDSPASDWILSVREIHHQGVNSGYFQATLTPSSQEIGITTLFSSTFGPDLKVNCDGALQLFSDMYMKCDAPSVHIQSSSLPPYFQLPEELSFSGEIEAQATFTFNDNQPSGNITFELNNGTFTYNEDTLSGVTLQVNLPNLPLLESSPSQVCTIGSMKFGTITMTNGLAHFRIENPQSLFLEKISLDWCGGKVETGSFRLSTALHEIKTTLYCDRLIFTELLDQFGIANTEGNGSLNGKLPVFLSSNSIQFDDGFLFSTPGNSGIVRFNNTDQLREGLPNMNQAAYLEYSMKAMENFSYNWTKLSFNSQDQDLLITMQLDGKPAEPLPFGYKNGHIVPSSAGPGLQHPIRLDVNFRLPLQNMFQYGKNIQSLMENL